MGLTVPAVHYSALASLPPDLTSNSQQSIQHTASVRFKLNQIFKKLLTNDIHHEQIISTETIGRETDKSIELKNPSNNNSGDRTFIEQGSPKPTSAYVEPLERLPFTEPYFSATPKDEQMPCELSAYHKHCIRQEQYIDQKQHPSEPPSTTKYRSNLTNYQLQKRVSISSFDNSYIYRQHQINFSKKPSNSTTTLPEAPSIEDHIGLKYASQRNTLTNNHNIRSSYIQQQTQHLRRLQSKTKIRPITNEPKPLSSSISSSIAHRIELLKQAMHNHQLEFHQPKSLPNEPSSPSILDPIHKQTQTTDLPSKSSEIHHIHHHHIYPSSLLSMPWRTYLSIVGTIALILLLLIQFITINF